jgi:uncharacterized protein YrrD
MENLENLKKWSALRGMAVVTVSEGKKIGTCDDLYFEPKSGSVYALRVKTGLLSHTLVLVTSINGIGQDAITIPDQGVLREQSDAGDMATLLSAEDLKKYKVMSEGGTLIGTIGTALLDISTANDLHVVAFELSGGIREKLSGKYPTFTASQVTSYGQDVLVIPDDAAQSLR